MRTKEPKKDAAWYIQNAKNNIAKEEARKAEARALREANKLRKELELNPPPPPEEPTLSPYLKQLRADLIKTRNKMIGLTC